MTEFDLELVLGWRNHPQVSNFMFNRHEISYAEHAEWFSKSAPYRYLLVFEVDGTPQGFINIEKPREGSGLANWGFYKAPDSLKGIGLALGGAGLAYAFEALKLGKINAEVPKFNEKSISLHLRLGFRFEGLHKKRLCHVEDCDILKFGLLAEEWLDPLPRKNE